MCVCVCFFLGSGNCFPEATSPPVMLNNSRAEFMSGDFNIRGESLNQKEALLESWCTNICGILSRDYECKNPTVCQSPSASLGSSLAEACGSPCKIASHLEILKVSNLDAATCNPTEVCFYLPLENIHVKLVVAPRLSNFNTFP